MFVVLHGGRIYRNHPGMSKIMMVFASGEMKQGNKPRAQMCVSPAWQTLWPINARFESHPSITVPSIIASQWPNRILTPSVTVTVALAVSNGTFVQQCSYLRCINVPGLLPRSNVVRSPTVHQIDSVSMTCAKIHNRNIIIPLVRRNAKELR